MAAKPTATLTLGLDRWDVGVGYDLRFGDLLLQPTCPHGERGPVKHVPMAAIMRTFGIKAADIRTAERDGERLSIEDQLSATEASICEAVIPADCSGMSVLDVGGYDGRFAARCMERGASEAVCLDNGQYRHYGWPAPEHRADVQYCDRDFLRVNRRYDLVLFFNVAYHVLNPWAAFEKLRRITRGQLALCSLITQDDGDTWRICAPREVNPEDDTVCWIPSETGLVKLLKNVGFETVEIGGKAGDRLALVAR